MENLRVLVTGATGFIGPHLIQRLTENNNFCRCLVRDIPNAQKKIPFKSVEFVQGDVTDKNSLKGIAENVDVIFHLATLGHLYNSEMPETMFQEINVKGSQNIAEEAIKSKVRKFIHCSSVAAMGICKEQPATESSECRPHHPYGISKLNAESAINEMMIENDLSYNIIRFSMVYGPGDWRDMLKIVKLVKKGLFPKIGSKPKLTPLIHVQDAVNALLDVAEKGKDKETYLITNENPEKFDDLRKYILQGLSIKRLPIYIPEWAALLAADVVNKTFSIAGKSSPVNRKNIESTIVDRVFSVEKAIHDFNFKTNIPAKQGIIETVQWYKEKGWV